MTLEPHVASEATAVPPFVPDEYERASYYNGITSDGDHPVLVYRSDFQSTSFPKPTGRFAHIPVKNVRGVFATSLNTKWPVVGPAICGILQDFGLHGWSVDPARFYTHAIEGEQPGRLGPVVVWIGVVPGSTSPELAHCISQKILALLLKNGIDDVVVEFREAETQQMSGPPLLRHVGTANATHHVRRFLTTHLGVSLTTHDWQDDGQGTLTLWFHENEDSSGAPSDRVLGLSCCHVLRRNTITDYEFKDGTSKNLVRACGMRRFQAGLDEITEAISDHSLVADSYARDIAKLLAGEPDEETPRELKSLKLKMEEENEAIANLLAFHKEVTQSWSDIKLQRTIGFVLHAPAVTVAEDTQYTVDWGVFVAAEAKVRPHFEGNVVDLGSKYSPPELNRLFYPVSGTPTTFKLPEQRKLRIVVCATEDDLARPTESDADGIPYLMVGKDGNTTGLTVGRYAGMVSYCENSVGVVSRELGIYGTGIHMVEPFSDIGDSGSLIWHMRDGKARMVGQVHSGSNKGGSTRNHITYATPAWFLLEQVKSTFKHADFYRSEW